ncbi:hypothetical protein FTUN_1627 [Frigoriglobus tundricola]|uniref:Protein kinase domain-containing protein n=1 Tax=Frigoriglobus tundricola TaxID=2774151 RepID=A0A6M5YJF6_9BACT|nr:hypothetical protein FTUN_1627 [Frigoriglobus tundricola]
MFSLGALLYELVCGTSPWTKEQERQLAAGVPLDVRPQPMGRFRRRVPPALEALVQRALAPDPTDRPTAAELAAELDALAPTLDDTPVRPLPAEFTDPDVTSVLPAVKWPA